MVRPSVRPVKIALVADRVSRRALPVKLVALKGIGWISVVSGARISVRGEEAQRDEAPVILPGDGLLSLGGLVHCEQVDQELAHRQ